MSNFTCSVSDEVSNRDRININTNEMIVKIDPLPAWDHLSNTTTRLPNLEQEPIFRWKPTKRLPQWSRMSPWMLHYPNDPVLHPFWYLCSNQLGLVQLVTLVHFGMGVTSEWEVTDSEVTGQFLLGAKIDYVFPLNVGSLFTYLSR